MTIERISQKALEKLRLKNIPPVPKAYFESFDEVLKAEGLDNTKGLNWRLLWLAQFDETTQHQLKNAKNPDEFISILAQIFKEQKDQSYIEQIHHLKALCRVILGTISDVFSINAKNKYHLLFRQGALNNSKATQNLCERWKNFRDSKKHLIMLRKLVEIIVKILRTSGPKNTMSKEALEISSTLMMHPESLSDKRMLECVEALLTNTGQNRPTTPIPLNTTALQHIRTCEERTQMYCVIIFEVSDIVVEQEQDDINTHQNAQNKAIEILKIMCMQKLGKNEPLEHHINRFASLFEAATAIELLNKITPIQQQLQAQKFSYKGMMFSLKLKVKILERKDFESFEKMIESVQKYLNNAINLL